MLVVLLMHSSALLPSRVQHTFQLQPPMLTLYSQTTCQKLHSTFYILSDNTQLAADEGWEGMDDIEVPLPEEPSAAAPQAALEAEPTTAVEAQPAVASAEDQQEQSGDDTVPESPFEDDDNEGWEDMEDLTAPLEVAEAAEQAAAVEPEAADEAESHGVGRVL